MERFLFGAFKNMISDCPDSAITLNAMNLGSFVRVRHGGFILFYNSNQSEKKKCRKPYI